MNGETEIEDSERQFGDVGAIMGASLVSFVFSFILTSIGTLISTTCHSLEPFISSTVCLSAYPQSTRRIGKTVDIYKTPHWTGSTNVF